MDFEKLIEFVREHREEDPLKLLLQQKKYPDVDMALVAQQIEGQRQALAKWPTLASCQYFMYPPRLNREQSSSEEASAYKTDIVERIFGKRQCELRIADLTGGMGIDSIAFAKMSGSTVDYVECNAELCQLMEHNADALGLSNIKVHCGDGIEWLRQSGQKYDIIYIDPARRDTRGKKVAAFEDCTPNVLEHRELLAEFCDHLMIKASPMMDIDKGIDTAHLDKGAIIFNSERDKGFVVSVVDNTNRGVDAIYWKDNFLHIKQRHDEYYNTHQVMQAYKKFVTDELPQQFEMSRADQADLLNRSVNFFKQNDNFEMDDFTRDVLGQPEVIDSFKEYKENYEREYDVQLPESFGISEGAVKKQSRSYKSVIKLDKNFHIYVHGDRKLIEQGEDEKGKYYKVYYNEET